MGTRTKSKRRSRYVLLIMLYVLLVLAAAVAGYFYAKTLLVKDEPSAQTTFDARSDLDNQPISQEERDNYRVAPDKPRYMSIPAINVQNARIQELGTVNKDGVENQLDDPINIHDVGWYHGSAKPGAGQGAGLYDGHNTGDQERGVFWDLPRVKIGDEIIIERGDGKVLTYHVVETSAPYLEDVDMDKMIQPADPDVEGLNIISCTGVWNKTKATFSHRLLVRAVIVNEP